MLYCYSSRHGAINHPKYGWYNLLCFRCHSLSRCQCKMASKGAYWITTIAVSLWYEITDKMSICRYLYFIEHSGAETASAAMIFYNKTLMDGFFGTDIHDWFKLFNPRFRFIPYIWRVYDIVIISNSFNIWEQISQTIGYIFYGVGGVVCGVGRMPKHVFDYDTGIIYIFNTSVIYMYIYICMYI